MRRGAVVVDPAASGFTTQAEQIHVMSDMFGRIFDGTIKFRGYVSAADFPVGIVAVIYDYGCGDDGMMRSQGRSMLRWALDHPSALVIVTSQITWQWLLDDFEMRDLVEAVNVILWNRDKIPAWFA